MFENIVEKVFLLVKFALRTQEMKQKDDKKLKIFSGRLTAPKTIKNIVCNVIKKRAEGAKIFGVVYNVRSYNVIEFGPILGPNVIQGQVVYM